MLKVFIDTSAIYTDPFWERTYAKELIAAAKSKKITIYISEVVYGELIYNYEKILQDECVKIQKSVSEINKISLKKHTVKLPNVIAKVKELEEFYKSLFIHKNIILLKVKPFVYKDVLKRAINHEKPFFLNSNKPQFKDSVIWCSYYKEFFKSNHTIHLISGNSQDFVKSELIKDYKYLECYESILDFVKTHKDYISKPSTSFQKWVSKSNINEQFIISQINKNLDIINSLQQTAFQYIEYLRNRNLYNPNNGDVMKDFSSTDITQELAYSNMKLSKLSKLEVDTFNNYSIINCEACITLDLPENSDSVSGSPSKTYHSEFYIPLSFTIDKEKTIKDMQSENYVVRRFSTTY